MKNTLRLSQLSQYTLIKVTGIEAKNYLQGQLTIDVSSLTPNTLYFSAHCDPKGKVIAVIRLWKSSDEIYYYLLPKSLEQLQLKELKKYAIFSKVNFEIIENKNFYLISEINLTQSIIQELNRHSHLIISFDNENILDSNHQANEHFDNFHIILNQSRDLLLITDESLMSELLTQLSPQVISQQDSSMAKGDERLTLKMIQQGQPIITEPTSLMHLPQALNLQLLQAISFSKGCYTGQEMVARAKYRGANKRALYCLKGMSEQVPIIGGSIHMRLGDKYKETGTVLAWAKDKDILWVQIILNKDIDLKTEFKITEEDINALKIELLPYSLEE